MKKQMAKLALTAGLVLWITSLFPGATARDAKSDFENVVGREVGVDVTQFTGPIPQGYAAYKWYHVDRAGDLLFVFIKVRPYLFGGNSITYDTSSPHKSLEDFPGVWTARAR